MVDFSKLLGKQPTSDLTDPLKLFDSLDRKGSHTTLRPAQIEALTALHQLRKERDHVLKLGTGVGKSSVALLYLRSYMAEAKRPGVYLCPTRQLVVQVLDEAARLGIQAFEYPGSERYPNPSCMNGDAVLVCTYAKLFNGISTFDRADVDITACAVVLDDAHSGIDEVRRAFKFQLTEEHITKPLIQILDGAARSYAPALWEEILLGRPERTVEIPFWLWAPLVDQVRAFLSAYVKDDQVAFVWPFLRDHLRWCRCVVGAGGIEIIPSVIPVELARVYNTAAHRLFMSGTLADESVLVKELGCFSGAAANPIVAGSDAGLGERMILAPTLIDPKFDRKWVMQQAAILARQVRVVVLCASEARAKDWTQYGATVVKKDAVIDVVEQLRTGRIKFAALAQRYDGVDLPDDACRVLILDGMPYGEGLVERHDNQGHSGPRSRLVFRIEQGMGRAVRSPADYAVAILSGPDLASFTSKVEVRELMSVDTRAQLELAHELATIAKQGGADSATSLVDMIRKCLNRDTGWKAFYDERVRKAVHPPTRRADDATICLAEAEQKAAAQARGGSGIDAAKTITAALNAQGPKDDAAKAPFIQQKANYLFDSNRGESLEAQKQAYLKNRAMLRPPEGVVIRPADPGRIQAAASLMRWYGGFVHQNGAIAEFQMVRSKLSFEQSHNVFEEGLKELAVFLGAEGSRPEEELGTGAPDNLLLWADISLVIEAKNEARYDEIPKRDAEQLLHSMEWFKDAYPTRKGTPVMVVQATETGSGIFMPEGSRIITPKLLDDLLNAIEGFLVALTTRAPASWTEKELATLLAQQRISAAHVVSTFSTPIR